MACFNSKEMVVKLVMCMGDEEGEINEIMKEKLLLVNNKYLQLTL
jgi:hypothetical protein